MSTIRRILFSAVWIAAALLVSTAPAQQKGKRGFGGGGMFGALANNAVSLAANEAVQKDIGVSSEIATKLNSLRDDWNAARQKEFQTAGINLQDFQNLTAEQRQKMNQIGAKLNEELNPKVKEILSADQYKRVQQILLQANLRTRGPGALTYPEVAAELKLTDEQKQKLQALQTELDAKQREAFSGGFDQAVAAKLREERTTKTMELLTADQKQTLEKLKGAEFDVSQLGGFGGRRGKAN
jgi:hypothetical protein